MWFQELAAQLEVECPVAEVPNEVLSEETQCPGCDANPAGLVPTLLIGSSCEGDQGPAPDLPGSQPEDGSQSFAVVPAWIAGNETTPDTSVYLPEGQQVRSGKARGPLASPMPMDRYRSTRYQCGANLGLSGVPGV